MKKYNLLLIALCACLSIFAQNIAIQSPVTANAVVANVVNSSVVGKTVSATGTVVFSNNSGVLRILLSNDNGYDLLIYESFPLLANNGIDNFSNQSFETRNVPSNTDFSKIRVELSNATLNSLTINISAQNALPLLALSAVVSNRITLLNNNLQASGALWRAGETSVSQMTYEEKKNLFGGTVPNLNGFEYYVGGIFVMPDYVPTATTSNSQFVSEFDWRNRHGKNWITSVKQQGCSDCWAFAATGTTEAYVNLYYNRLLNIDLSEQDVLSCGKAGTCSGGDSGSALNYIKNTGIVNEGCFQYTHTDLPCTDKCSNSNEKIRIGNYTFFSTYVNNEDSLKTLIMKAPMCFGLSSWWHAIGLIGFKTIRANDRIFVKTSTEAYWITVEEGNPLIGADAWIIKNSHGTGWGENGYGYVVTNWSNIYLTFSLSGNITSQNYTDADIRCVDEDGDGYYWWGIGPKPATCPNCPDEPDGDDSNPLLGPMDEYGNCQVLPHRDLLIRDDFDDDGTEPNPRAIQWDASPDLWLQDQFFTRHLYASELVSGLNCYVCFNVKNIGNATSNPARMHLYWTKETLNPVWPLSWTGGTAVSLFTTSVLLGGRITPSNGVSIPALAPNERYYSCYPWTVPNSGNIATPLLRIVGGGNGRTNNWNYLFLARIDDGNTVQHLNETLYSSALFAQENNNVVVNNADLIVSGMYYQPAFYINPSWNPNTLNTLGINQLLANNYTNNGQSVSLRDFAELYINFSPAMFELLQRDNTEKDGFKIVEENRILITSDKALLHFKPLVDTAGLYFVGTEVNFISDKMPELNDFQFELAYTDGGVTERRMLKAVRNLDVYFKAQAEASKTKVVRAKEEVILTSNLIFDDAEYIWYDEAGDKVGTGYQITVIPDRSQTYKIEIMKKEDGYKSYDEVSVTVVDGIINSLSPNPASSEVTVDYKLSDFVGNAQIEIIDMYNNSLIKQPLSVFATRQSVSLAGITPGTYLVTLIIDGTVVDAKPFIKN